VTTILEGVEALQQAKGLDLGVTGWHDMDSHRVQLFEASLRSAGPSAGAPAPLPESVPELLVLALTNMFLPLLVEVRGVSAGVNYGTGEVRFPARAPVGARLRAGGLVVDVAEVAGGVQTTTRVTVEAEGVAAAVCVVDAISRWLA
jgi:hypothetical protein